VSRTPKIGVRLPAGFDSAGEFLADAQALEAAGADLLAVGEGELDARLLLAALAAATTRTLLLGPDDPTLALLCRGRLVIDVGGWAEESFPRDRQAWRELLAEHSSRGTDGLILDMDPRLLDLLRNPDLEDDRSTDLQLAQG
jgi:hypothetical protein